MSSSTAPTAAASASPPATSSSQQPPPSAGPVPPQTASSSSGKTPRIKPPTAEQLLIESALASSLCNEISTSSVNLLFESAWTKIQEHYIQNVAQEQVAQDAVEFVMQAIEWQLLIHDEGEKLGERKALAIEKGNETSASSSSTLPSSPDPILSPSSRSRPFLDSIASTLQLPEVYNQIWTCEEEPAPCEIDRWARGVIPTKGGVVNIGGIGGSGGFSARSHTLTIPNESSSSASSVGDAFPSGPSSGGGGAGLFPTVQEGDENSPRSSASSRASSSIPNQPRAATSSSAAGKDTRVGGSRAGSFSLTTTQSMQPQHRPSLSSQHNKLLASVDSHTSLHSTSSIAPPSHHASRVSGPHSQPAHPQPYSLYTPPTKDEIALEKQREFEVKKLEKKKQMEREAEKQREQREMMKVKEDGERKMREGERERRNSIQKYVPEQKQQSSSPVVAATKSSRDRTENSSSSPTSTQLLTFTTPTKPPVPKQNTSSSAAGRAKMKVR